MEQDVDLDFEHRTYLLELYGCLDELTYYELLGVPQTADKKAIKQALYRLAGVIHPDRYFGKRLGSYRGMLEAIFARVSHAAETLSDADRRAEYDSELDPTRPSRPAPSPPASTRTPPAVPAASAAEADIDRKRRVAREALNAQFGDRAARGHDRAATARRHADAAAKARAAGDLVAAAESLRIACTYAPDDATLRAEYERVSREARERMAASHERQAQVEERYGHWKNAAESWRRVLEAKPDDPEASRRLAVAIERARGK